MGISILKIQSKQLEAAAEVIRASFATVAEEFGITKEMWPNHTSFMTAEKLQNHFGSGWLMYGLYDEGQMTGYVSLSKENGGAYMLHNLAVLPGCRHKGCGRQLLDFCVDKVKELGGAKIQLSLIEENTVLKNWYEAYGFEHKGIRKHEIFIEGFMEFIPISK
ncbi:MAG: GNAT family N-acetyltransferase [Oscillospiraceae bacterium]|nr:GNAT family N-acetyltransferase [Oscillospiraceae bacterium]